MAKKFQTNHYVLDYWVIDYSRKTWSQGGPLGPKFQSCTFLHFREVRVNSNRMTPCMSPGSASKLLKIGVESWEISDFGKQNGGLAVVNFENLQKISTFPSICSESATNGIGCRFLAKISKQNTMLYYQSKIMDNAK